MNKLRKNLTAVLGFGMLIAVLASCSRGGYGCPYELEIASEAINCLLN